MENTYMECTGCVIVSGEYLSRTSLWGKKGVVLQLGASSSRHFPFTWLESPWHWIKEPSSRTMGGHIYLLGYCSLETTDHPSTSSNIHQPYCTELAGCWLAPRQNENLPFCLRTWRTSFRFLSPFPIFVYNKVCLDSVLLKCWFPPFQSIQALQEKTASSHHCHSPKLMICVEMDLWTARWIITVWPLRKDKGAGFYFSRWARMFDAWISQGKLANMGERLECLDDSFHGGRGYTSRHGQKKEELVDRRGAEK